MPPILRQGRARLEEIRHHWVLPPPDMHGDSAYGLDSSMWDIYGNME
jgi:hypothetical protein